MNVELSAEAEAQVRAIDAWWRQNRHAVPDLFTNELAQALNALRETPGLGTPYDVRTSSVRRMLLRRTHYHIYFVEQASRLQVVAVWSAFRGRGPKL